MKGVAFRERRALMWHCEHRGAGHYRAHQGYQRDVCCRPTTGKCPKCRRAICDQHAAAHMEEVHP